MSDSHDHGLDHPDWDPFWRNHESQLPQEQPACDGSCGVCVGDVVTLTGYAWDGAQGVVKWQRRVEGGAHRLGLRVDSQRWHGDGLLFVDCCQVRA